MTQVQPQQLTQMIATMSPFPKPESASTQQSQIPYRKTFTFGVHDPQASTTTQSASAQARQARSLPTHTRIPQPSEIFTSPVEAFKRQQQQIPISEYTPP